MNTYDFLELPIIIYNNQEQELTNKQPDECELIEAIKKVNASRIESYREAIPASDFRDNNKIWTEVVMESGEMFIVNMSLTEFEKVLKINFVIR
jgi:hypothetical protein